MEMTSFEWIDMAKYGIGAAVALLVFARILMRD
jgi:hypothetical protein